MLAELAALLAGTDGQGFRAVVRGQPLFLPAVTQAKDHLLG
jgi:hypothetical protein